MIQVTHVFIKALALLRLQSKDIRAQKNTLVLTEKWMHSFPRVFSGKNTISINLYEMKITYLLHDLFSIVPDKANKYYIKITYYRPYYRKQIIV